MQCSIINYSHHAVRCVSYLTHLVTGSSHPSTPSSVTPTPAPASHLSVLWVRELSVVVVAVQAPRVREATRSHLRLTPSLGAVPSALIHLTGGRVSPVPGCVLLHGVCAHHVPVYLLIVVFLSSFLMNRF